MMDERVKTNENNNYKIKASLVSGTPSYQRDNAGNLVLDENGNPIPINPNGNLQYMTEGGNS